jgi:hypothetical protein
VQNILEGVNGLPGTWELSRLHGGIKVQHHLGHMGLGSLGGQGLPYFVVSRPCTGDSKSLKPLAVVSKTPSCSRGHFPKLESGKKHSVCRPHEDLLQK